MVTACYIPQGLSVLTSFTFPQKQSRNIDVFSITIAYHYTRDATASLRGQL